MMNSAVCLGIPGIRRSANWQPTSWSGHKIQSLTSAYVFNDLQYCKRHKELKQAVQQMLEGVIKEHLEQRHTLINDIQRLGVAYHFEQQIHDALVNSLLYLKKEQVLWNKNLHTTSLYFRLLRQHGCYVSPDIFMEFKDEAGGFKASLCEDVDGLLSLYEASYLGIKNEIILDEAKIFTVTNLKKLMGHVEEDIRRRISDALDLPLHWKPGRIENRNYIDVYKKKKRGGNDCLLEFAQLDFNMVQIVHQRDINDLLIWWESIDLSRKLKFCRDGLMESFLNSVELTPEPQFFECRKGAAKIILIITIIDDIYDVYGSLDELELFTNAIERWDLEVIDQLPEYMKLCYLALFNTMNEHAYLCMKDKGCNVLNYNKKLWTSLCKAYLTEARWFHKKYTPTLKEYLDNGWVSIATPLIVSHLYPFMLQKMTEEGVDDINKYEKLISLMSLIFRLCDDLGTSKAEMERGDVAKSIQCYMHEAKVSEEVAREQMKHLIDDAWKELNEECLKALSSEHLHRSFINAIVNCARGGSFLYNHGDDFGKPSHEADLQATKLFFQPIPLNDQNK